MKQNARLVRPHVAVFTNILPAHLEFHPDLATIAARKSAIFEAMDPGAVVVLNREMAEWERVNLAARVRGLSVINYGKSPGCDLQLLRFDNQSRTVSARFAGRDFTYRLGAPGEHMAANSLAALSAVAALGHDPMAAAERLQDFAPLAGRGRELALEIGDRRVRLLDESYNANPGSMEAALKLLGTTSGSSRRIAVMGEMLELGERSIDYHTAVAEAAARLPIDRVYLLGEAYSEAWDRLPEEQRALHASTRDQLREAILHDALDGDVWLIKGSHGSGLHKLVTELESAGERSES
jgi:UDP-N-acetylmuramyl pentapeptide synthase